MAGPHGQTCAWKAAPCPPFNSRRKHSGARERFHKTILRKVYQVAFHKKIYHTPDELVAKMAIFWRDKRPGD
jgi:hypothetical protein